MYVAALINYKISTTNAISHCIKIYFYNGIIFFTAMHYVNQFCLFKKSLSCFLLFFIAVFVCSFSATAQNDRDTLKKFIQRDYTFRLHYGVIYAHSIHIQNTAGAHPRGAEFEFAKRLVDEKTKNYYGCFSRTGFMFSYFDFNTRILGKAYSLSYFLEPNYRLGNNVDFFIKGAAGLSYLTNPHDSIKNPANQTYSLPINFFMSVGTGLDFKINRHISFGLMASFEHNSNGGFAQPNRGINYPSASLSIKYNPVDNTTPLYKRTKDTTWKANRFTYDVSLFYSPKEGYTAHWKSERKFVVGINPEVAWRVSAIDAVTAAAEVYYDEGIKSIKYNLHDSSSNTFGGFLIGHQFLFRKIIFSQQLGFYLVKHTDVYTDLYRQPFSTIYHRWGLSYKLKPHWYIGFNMLVHDDVADFIDGRVTYKF